VWTAPSWQEPKPAVIQNQKLDFANYVVAEIAVVDRTGAVVHYNCRWEETAKIGGLPQSCDSGAIAATGTQVPHQLSRYRKIIRGYGWP
jgi:hypothetical protein